MRNTKMPVYDKSNLIDFSKKRKGLRALRYPKINLPDTLFILACIFATGILLFSAYRVWFLI